MSSAPVCLINPPAPPFPTKAPILIPVPNPIDLQSALKAIQALRQNLMIMQNYMIRNNTLVEPVNIFNAFGQSAAQKPTKANSFTEIHRQTKTTRIFDPNDKTVFVDVEQVTSLTLQDKTTQQTLTWNQ